MTSGNGSLGIALRLTCYKVCDNISCHAKERFAFTKHLSAAKMFNPCFFQANENYQRFPSAELEETTEAYPFLNKERLITKQSLL